MGEFNKESIKYQQNLFLNARKKPLPLIISDKSFIVGVTGFEPATSRPPAERATKLRHTPEVNSLYQNPGKNQQKNHGSFCAVAKLHGN